MRILTIKKITYLILAVLGALLTWYFNIQFIVESHGQLSFAALLQFDWLAFIAGGFANPAASSLSVDLLIVLVAGLVFLVSEARRLGMRNWWIYLVLSGLVAAAFAFPLFLFMREYALERQA